MKSTDLFLIPLLLLCLMLSWFYFLDCCFLMMVQICFDLWWRRKSNYPSVLFIVWVVLPSCSKPILAIKMSVLRPLRSFTVSKGWKILTCFRFCCRCCARCFHYFYGIGLLFPNWLTPNKREVFIFVTVLCNKRYYIV